MTTEEPSMEEAIAYVREIKTKLSHRHKECEELLSVLHDFGINKISPPSVVSKVQSLLDGEPDLMRGFNTFIPNHCVKLSCPNIQETELGVPETPLSPKKQIQVPKKVTKKDVLRGVEFVNRVQRRLNKHPTTMREFFQVMIEYGNNHDLEFVKGKLSVILNNKCPEWVIDFSQFCSSVMKKNVMDDYEDAMYEVEMLMNWMKSAKEATQRLFEACEKNPSERIDVATYLNSMNLRSIEQLYGDGIGVIILEKLHQSPGLASSVILPRLSQKLEEIIAEKIEIISKVRQYHMGRLKHN